MTDVIRARVPCPRCGNVCVTLADLCLSPGHSGGAATYEFRCPSCGERVVREADTRVQRVLARNEVPLTDTGLAEQLRLAGIEAEAADDLER